MAILHPPIYLAHGRIDCYTCQREMPVVALIANASEEEDPNDEVWPAFIHYLSASSGALVDLVQNRHAEYRLAHSKMADMSYYANHCPHCKAFSGDHYVMGPDGPFFPSSDKPPIELEILPVEGSLEVDCSPAWGVADEVISAGKLRG